MIDEDGIVPGRLKESESKKRRPRRLKESGLKRRRLKISPKKSTWGRPSTCEREDQGWPSTREREDQVGLRPARGRTRGGLQPAKGRTRVAFDPREGGPYERNGPVYKAETLSSRRTRFPQYVASQFFVRALGSRVGAVCFSPKPFIYPSQNIIEYSKCTISGPPNTDHSG